MCGNRVEELEEQVQQLQATVDGLTDELVECKVRIRELENAVDYDPGPRAEEDEPEQPADEETAAESDNTEGAEPSGEQESETESDIIIA